LRLQCVHGVLLAIVVYVLGIGAAVDHSSRTCELHSGSAPPLQGRQLSRGLWMLVRTPPLPLAARFFAVAGFPELKPNRWQGKCRPASQTPESYNGRSVAMAHRHDVNGFFRRSSASALHPLVVTIRPCFAGQIDCLAATYAT